MTVFSEGQYAGEFIVSEGNGAISRTTKTLTSGQKVVDGQVLALATSKLVALDADDMDTGGVAGVLVGIVVGNWDASATGTNADILGVPYITRMAEVNGAALTYFTNASVAEIAQVDAALEDMFIIIR